MVEVLRCSTMDFYMILVFDYWSEMYYGLSLDQLPISTKCSISKLDKELSNYIEVNLINLKTQRIRIHQTSSPRNNPLQHI